MFWCCNSDDKCSLCIYIHAHMYIYIYINYTRIHSVWWTWSSFHLDYISWGNAGQTANHLILSSEPEAVALSQGTDTPSHAHPDRLLGLGKWGAWARGKHPCRVLSLSKDWREWGRTQLMPQVRTRVPEHSITKKEGHSRGSSCCCHPHRTQKGTLFQESSSYPGLYICTRAFPGKSGLIAGFCGLCLPIKLSVN